MSKELSVVLDAGLTVSASLLLGDTVAVSGIAMSDAALPGFYTGSVPAGTAAGSYNVLALLAGTIVATGSLRWDGTAELVPGLPPDPLASKTTAYAAGTAGAALEKLNVLPSPGPVIVIPAPPGAVGVCRVYGFLELPDKRPAANVLVSFTLMSQGAIASERLIAGREATATTDATGRLMSSPGKPWIDLNRTDLLTPATASYEISCEAMGVRSKRVLLTTVTADLRALLTT